MSERGCRSPTHRSRSATPSKRVLQKLRNKCSITPEQPLHYPRNGCSIWIGTGAPLRPEGALGTVHHVDPRQQVLSWASPEGGSGQIGYDRLILTAGSVNKLLPVPGVAQYAHGFRSIAEVIYLRDHLTRQLELAAIAADPAERAARCTFVVVGAGYTGTEVTAQGQLLTTRLAKKMPGLAGQQMRWMLLDTAPRLLP